MMHFVEKQHLSEVYNPAWHNARRLLSILVSGFVISSVLIPVAVVNKLFFAGLIGITIWSLSPNDRVGTVSPWLIFSIFVYGFLLSLFAAHDPGLVMQLVLSVILLFSIYGVRKYHVDLDSIIKTAGITLCLFTGLFYYFFFFGRGSALADLFLNIFEKYSEGAFGVREFSEDTTFMFHVGTVPFLFLPFSLFMLSAVKRPSMGNIVALFVIIATMVSSTSRGLLITSMFSACVILFIYSSQLVKVISMVICIPLIAGILYYVNSTSTALSLTEASNFAKIGHVTSFISQLTPINFFFGNGLATYYFSTGKGALAAQTEITPLDMARYFGIPLTFLLYLLLLVPTFRRSAYTGDNMIYVVIFAMYLLLSSTNPILFNSFGLIVVVWYWSKILRPVGDNSRLAS